jgi:hypothetical protein
VVDKCLLIGVRSDNTVKVRSLRLRLEVAHTAVEAAMVEARRRVRFNEGR